MTHRENFSQLLAAGLTVSMFDELESWPEEYSEICNLETSSKAYDEYQKYAGLGVAMQKIEGKSLDYDDPIQGGSKRIYAETFALGWICTMEMLADDQYSRIRSVPGELTGSIKHMMEQTAANVYNLGFTTTTTTDGLSLFNTAHPLLGTGGTLSNRHPTNAGLSQTALQDLVVLGQNYTNDRGLKRRVELKQLDIPPELQWIAKRVLKGDLEPGTGNNDINTAKGLVEFNIRHYFTSTVAYFLRAQKHKVTFITRQKPQTEAADDFDTKGQKHSIVARFGAGAWDWPGVMASSGVGS